MRLPRDYPQRMEALGIRCCTFHRFQPIPTGTLNNRDHRKICCVDGVTAFTGGVNLADEYINRARALRALAGLRRPRARPRGLLLRADVPRHVGLHQRRGRRPRGLPARSRGAGGHSRRRLRPALLRLPRRRRARGRDGVHQHGLPRARTTSTSARPTSSWTTR